MYAQTSVFGLGVLSKADLKLGGELGGGCLGETGENRGLADKNTLYICLEFLKNEKRGSILNQFYEGPKFGFLLISWTLSSLFFYSHYYFSIVFLTFFLAHSKHNILNHSCYPYTEALFMFSNYLYNVSLYFPYCYLIFQTGRTQFKLQF